MACSVCLSQRCNNKGNVGLEIFVWNMCGKCRASDPAAVGWAAVNKLQRQVCIRECMKKRLVSLLKRGVTSYEGRNTFVMFFFFCMCWIQSDSKNDGKPFKCCNASWVASSCCQVTCKWLIIIKLFRNLADHVSWQLLHGLQWLQHNSGGQLQSLKYVH